MTLGKITIESGEYKSIFEFDNQKCTVSFEPIINVQTTEKSENQIFVENLTSIVTNCLIK